MQLICISRGSYSGGKAFAESLAENLGCSCIGREELLDLATDAGVAAGKLEMACLKPRGLNERMLLEREHYQAFITATLAERALNGPLVYHGRTGHLLLQGVPNILRIRVVADLETRIKSVTERLGLERTKARQYIDQVEEDRRKWVRTFYNIDWDASSAYDFTINVEQTQVANVASAFCAVAQLPDFQQTPAARKTLQDLLLASRCRIALANDDRTYLAGFNVRAEGGTVSVSYLPRHAELAEAVPAVVQAVPGVERVLCTMASTRVLWIQQRFEPAAPAFGHLLELADKWEAAVELLQLKASDSAAIIERAPNVDEPGSPPSQRPELAGIEEDASDAGQPAAGTDDEGLEETFNALVKAGRAGGRIRVQGSAGDVLAAIDHTAPYSLVVIGDTFLDKGKAARIRLTRELGNTLHERMKVAVIQAEEMQRQYLFGPRQLLSMLFCFGLTALLFYLVFTHQDAVLRFLTREGTSARILAATCIFFFVPFFAFTYGKATHYLLKLIKME